MWIGSISDTLLYYYSSKMEQNLSFTTTIIKKTINIDLDEK